MIAMRILEQLTVATRMAVGARNFKSGKNSLTFDVGTGRKKVMIIRLNAHDTYDIELLQMPHGRSEGKVLEYKEGIYFDQLNEVVYRLVNK